MPNPRKYADVNFKKQVIVVSKPKNSIWISIITRLKNLFF